MVQNCESQMTTGGDSGGPVFDGTTAYGIIKAAGGNFFCPHKMLFVSNAQFQNALDVEIVLAP